MKYMLLIYGDPDHAPTPEDREPMFHAYMAFSEELQSRGAMVGGAPLAPTASATTVRVRDGHRVVTDGPFAETKEWLGGYYLIEAASLDDALEFGAKCPGAQYGSVEIRPVVDPTA